jgi:hypothetical protein
MTSASHPGQPQNLSGVAFNTVPDTANPIHGDAVARRFGFEGGLVPGVVVSAYLAEPALPAWGEAWLSRGHGRVAVRKPLYDGRGFTVAVNPAGDTCDATLTDDRGVLSAEGRLTLPVAPPAPPARLGDPTATDKAPATREGLERLRARGAGSVVFRFGRESESASYHRDPGHMPELVRPGVGGFAHDAWLLGTTNWWVAANVALGPWIHLEVEWQRHAPLREGTDLVIEGSVADLFERKGHEMLDAELAGFTPDGAAVYSARLRAIYRLRGG